MTLLCAMSELQENTPRGFSLGDDPDTQDVFLIKRDGQVYAFKNSCPHTGATMNWLPDAFMDMEGFYIQCSIHGALFNVEDGLCVRGPCVNQSLTPATIRIENQQIFLD
ncbi:MAG: Rieske 2Fe-2S domain-containing protein [Gammaproteobacteria bacterium]|nr:Rieske 2Fe-2S domain-containing protein [Gammaproteobacteria bacterium]